MGYPWFYYNIKDSRTLLSLQEVDQPKVNHDSVQDCIRQIIGVQQVLQKLGVKEFTEHSKAFV
ncbi:Uncharacterised protein [uncultured archaeon]|nr:Uncharacterised protein [uncultured archaeon]